MKKKDYDLQVGAQNDDVTKVEKALKSGADPNQQGGWTFATACRNGNLKIVKLFIDKGVDISGTALGYASETGSLEVIKLLLDNGAEITDPHGILIRTMSFVKNEDIRDKVLKLLVPKVNPEFIINKLPELTKYVIDPKYSHITMASKFGMFDD
jgi:ankyrin repeat protein